MIRAAIYTRVSSREQVDGHSLDAQARACRGLCDQRGYQVVAEFSDEGISARSDQVAKRPAFAQLMADADRGAFDVVVVHKMDRFARNLRVQLECLDRLGKGRTLFVSVSEPNLDYSRPGDFLVLTMFGAMAQQYSMNLSQETKKGWDERRRKGLYCGLLPFGAMKGPDGVPVPDTRALVINGSETSNYQGLLLAFQRAAEGADDLEVAEALNAAGYRPSARNKRGLFTRESVRVILTNRFYLGELPRGKRGKEGWQKAAHEAMIPQELWDQAQRQRTKRQASRPTRCAPGKARVYSLSGLVRCGKCGGKLHTYLSGGKPRVYCYSRDLLGGCGQTSAALAQLESQVEDFLEQLTIPDNYQEIVVRALQAERPEASENVAKHQQAQARLRRVRDLYELGDLSRAEYETKRGALRAELAHMEAGYSLLAGETLPKLRFYLQQVPAAWRDATPEQRNELARLLFEEVVVDDRRVVGAVPRTEYLPFFALDEAARTDRGKATPPPQRAGVSTEFEEAGSRGFEPPISALTGPHVRPLHHEPRRLTTGIVPQRGHGFQMPVSAPAARAQACVAARAPARRQAPGRCRSGARLRRLRAPAPPAVRRAGPGCRPRPGSTGCQRPAAGTARPRRWPEPLRSRRDRS
jgi:site-specific DNA recombinase